MDQDEVRLVGCIVSDEDAFWFCRDCDADILEEGWLAPDGEVARELERLAELREDGVIDDNEFQAARKKLLDQGALS
ncbi:SHOCT domain-containing protein [bacterium AH-315-A03]|nr:SHOCT domain-containing protein [bacterium AH-315-A03]